MIKIIDNQFNFLGAVDDYSSFIAEKSYFGIGKFELHLAFNKEYNNLLQEENILFLTPDKPYIILYKEISSDANSMKVMGEELKHYMSRWITKPPAGQAYHRLNTNAETIIKDYVRDNALIPNLVVETDLGRGQQLIFQTRYKQLDEELEKIGLVSGLGWTVKLDLVNNKFVFDILEGKNRTVSQSTNTPAIFSIDFDNVGQQNFTKSKIGYKNIAYVAGQGEGDSRVIEVVGTETGFNRYETFVDARDVEDNNDLPDRGLQKLAELQEVLSFESEILTNSNLIYEEDFNIGDTVTIQNKEWNVTLDSIIENITEIHEVAGFRLDATFGNNLPTVMEVVKKKIDTPISESGDVTTLQLDDLAGTGRTTETVKANADNIATKANLASPTFTGTVAGITKTMVGLSNVPNLSFSGSNTGDQTLPTIANNLTETVAGKVLDATQGKIINDDLDAHKAESASKHITESGSNANGSYIKFDDGTMICTHELTSGVGNTANGALWFSPLMSWTFPSAFTAIPEYFATPKRLVVGGGANPISVSRPTSGAVNFSSVTALSVLYQASSATTQTAVSIMAIGRWK